MATNPTPLTPAELAGLDEVYAKGTPGKWASQTARTLLHVGSMGGTPVFSVSISPPRIPEPHLRDQIVAETTANVECIVALHNAYPRLRATIEAQAAEIGRLKDGHRESMAALDGLALAYEVACRMEVRGASPDGCPLDPRYLSAIVTLTRLTPPSGGKEG